MEASTFYTTMVVLASITCLASTWNALLQTSWYRHYLTHFKELTHA